MKIFVYRTSDGKRVRKTPFMSMTGARDFLTENGLNPNDFTYRTL